MRRDAFSRAIALGEGTMRTSAMSPRTDLAASGRVEQGLADAERAVARLRRGPHHHVVHLVPRVDVGDLVAGEEDGGVAAHVASASPTAPALARSTVTCT